MTGLLISAALAGGAMAQMGPQRGFAGHYGGGPVRGFRGPPGRFMPDRRPFPGPGRPPPQGPYGPGANSPPGANSLGADWREQQDEARQGVRHGQLAPLGRVIEGIGRRAPGRQLDTGIEYQGDRPVYRVRWVTAHGRRVDYIVDAATGAILSER